MGWDTEKYHLQQRIGDTFPIYLVAPLQLLVFETVYGCGSTKNGGLS